MKLQSIFCAMVFAFGVSATQANEVPEILSSVSNDSVKLMNVKQAKKTRGETIYMVGPQGGRATFRREGSTSFRNLVYLDQELADMLGIIALDGGGPWAAGWYVVSK